MKIHSIYDSPDYIDRFTVYYKGRGTINRQTGFRAYVGMSSAPFHPQGFCQHGEGKPGKHNGKKITFEDLPNDCQKAVLNDLK